MTDMLYKATKYMNAEDIMIAEGADQRKERDKTIPTLTKKESLLERMIERTIGNQDPRLGGLSTSRH